jgi:hypothetical protein
MTKGRSTSPNILQRIHKVMESNTYIQKEKKRGMQYSITSHDAVTAKLRPDIVEQGIVYYPTRLDVSQDGNRTQINGIVRFCNIDDREDFIEVAAAGYGNDNQDKGPGKAQSYLVKYALLKLFGLETGDDPDYDQVTPHNPEVVQRMDDFIQQLPACEDLESLEALREVFRETISLAGQQNPAASNRARQAYAARKKELEG